MELDSAESDLHNGRRGGGSRHTSHVVSSSFSQPVMKHCTNGIQTGDHKMSKSQTSGFTIFHSTVLYFIAGYFKQLTRNSQITLHLEEWSECLIHWGVLQALAVDMRPKLQDHVLPSGVV